LKVRTPVKAFERPIAVSGKGGNMAFRRVLQGSGLIAAVAWAASNADFTRAVSGGDRPVIPVHVETVASERSTPALVVPGVVEAKVSRSLAFRAAGRIARFRVAEGDRVEPGDAIAEFDRFELEGGVRAARAALVRARERWAETERRYGRQQQLLELASDSRWQQGSVRIESAVRGDEMRYARAVLAAAEARLAAGVLRAPAAGIVDRRYGAVGEVVSPGAPVVRLTELATVALRAEVPLALLPLVRVGGSAVVRSGAAGGGELAGTIRRVAPAADPASGVVSFEVWVENRGLALRPAMVAEIAVDVAQREAVCTIPLVAVLRGIDARPFSFVVVGEDANLRVERRRLTLGGLQDDRVSVIAGLVAGDRVVTLGRDLVTVGDGVTIVGEEI
jgi:RND family efflux transporter MFP subunit